MKIVRPLHALGWFAAGTVCVVFAARLYGSAVAPKSSAGLLCWGALCYGMFLTELTRRVSPKKSREFPGVPVKPSVYTVFFRSMRKAGIRFSRNANSLLMDMIVDEHANQPTTVELILACFGELSNRGKIRPKNFASAPPGDDVALRKALKKLSTVDGKEIYTTKVYDGTILVSVDENDIDELNSALAPHAVEFKRFEHI